MGEDKALLDAGGRPFLARVIDVLKAHCDPVLVVVRADRDDIARVAAQAGATVLINPDPADGPISSIRVALDALADNSDSCGMVLLPVDHPAVSADTVGAVVAAFRMGEADTARAPEIVVPVVDGQTGHPPLFGSRVFTELMDRSLQGGARTVLHADPSRVLRFSVQDPGVLLDIDTPDDWDRAVATGLLEPPRPTPDPARPLTRTSAAAAAAQDEYRP